MPLRWKPPEQHQCTGFTLLEVMLAVTIFAVVALSIQNVSSQMVRQLQSLQQKTFATWVAENQLNQMRLQEQPPAAGSSTEKMTYAGRDWVVDTVIADAGQGLKRIEVVVFLDLSGIQDDQRVFSLSGFLGSSQVKEDG